MTYTMQQNGKEFVVLNETDAERGHHEFRVVDEATGARLASKLNESEQILEDLEYVPEMSAMIKQLISTAGKVARGGKPEDWETTKEQAWSLLEKMHTL